jgi:RHS repeat-associated protein
MSKNNCDGKKLCLRVLKQYTFTFGGETFRHGDTFGTDDPCEAAAWVRAAEDAYKALTNDTTASVSTGGLKGGGGMAGIYRACEAAKRRRAEAVESATAFFQNIPPITLGEPNPDPGTGDSPPGGEETPETLDTPSTEPIAEVGITNPEDLPDYAKSVEGVADGAETLERIKKMRETMSEEEIEDWFKKNKGPIDEPHPEHSESLNADGVSAGDPVLLASGQFDLRVVDVELASVGMPLRFERVYRSGPRYFGPLGFNWDHTYNQSLRLLARDRVAHWTGQLQEHVYEPAANGTMEPPLGVHRRLRRVSGLGDPEKWELEEAQGTRWTFALPPNAPSSIRLPLVRFEDRHGNAQLFDYDSQGRLARVHDGYGRALTLHYGACDFLEALEDHTGRRWSYLHDEQAEHLIAVRTPAVEGGSHQVEYYYDETHPDPNYRHNLTRVSDGRGVIVENEYSRELGPNYARVVYQRLGGVAISYEYAQIQDVPPIPENVDASATRTMVRREGEGLRVYAFNFRGELLDERLRLVADGTMRLLVHAYRYDPAGNLKLKMEPGGITALFDYDHAASDPRARGNLLRTSIRPSPLTPGPTRTISQARYEPRYQLRTEVRDEAGAVTKFVYDFDQGPGGTGKLVQIEHPSATLANGEVQHAVERFTCNASGRWTEHITAAGHRHTRRYHPSGAIGAGLLAEDVLDADGTPVRTLYDYDAVGRVAREEDGLGNVTTYVNDALDRTIRIVPPLVDGGSAEMRFVFDPSGLLVREEGPRGSYEDPALVGDTIVTVHRYDAHGRRVETVVGHGSSSERRMRAAYNPDGRLTAYEDPLGRLHKFRYDERGLVIEDIAAAETPEERRVRHRYDRTGRRVATIAAGREHRYEYDRYGRLAARIHHDGTREERERGVNDRLLKLRVLGRPAPGQPPRILSEKGYEYDERGRIRRTRVAVFTDDPSTAMQVITQVFPDPDGRIVRAVDHSGSTSRSTYSGLGAPLSIEDAAGNRRTFTCDAAGNCLSVTHHERRAAGPEDTFTLSYTYDARRQRRSETDPLGNVSRWSFDARGLLTSEVDPLGVELRYVRDVEGRIVAQERHLGGDADVVRYQIERDLAGRVTAMIDPIGQRCEFRRSAFDELTEILLPDGFRIERGYRPTGELLFERHPDGRELRVDIDETTRRISFEAIPAPGDVAAPAQALEKDGLGRVVSARSGGHVITRSYDSISRLISEQRGDDEVSYTHDDAARTVLRTRSGGRAERLHYDVLGRLSRVALVTPGNGETALPAGTELCRYTYDGPTRVASRQDGNGVVDERDYDRGFRLASQTVRRSGGGAIAQLRFLHDAIGRTVALARSPAPLRNALARYDRRSRLLGLRTGVTLPPLPTASTQVEADAVLSTLSAPLGAAGEEFTVSDADETLERQELADGGASTSQVFTPGPFCRIAQVDGVPAAYDGRGHLVDDGERSFAYDAFGRLVRVVRKSDDAVLLALEHDALGRVTTRTVGGESVSLLYEGHTLLSEVRPNGERTEHVPGLAPGETVCVTRNGQAHWAHQDENRSLLATTDASGAVVDRYAFSAFGIPGVFNANGAQRPAPASGVAPVFGGHRYLESPGLFLMGPRVYDPLFGRFLQPDPAWPRDSASPYSYAGHDPVNLTDPTGLCLPRPGSSGSGGSTGSGSGSGAGGTGSSSGGSGGSSWGMNFGRGLLNVSWGVLLFAFAVLILSGPWGWYAGLVATMTMAAGFASTGIGLARMVTAHTRTEAQDAELTRSVSAATSIASGPGSLIGATVAAGTGHDPEKGAMIGGITEGGLSLAKGLGNVLRMEYTFWRLPKLSYDFKGDIALKEAVRQSIGPSAASASRPSPLFFYKNPIEWWEMSHFVPEKLIKGYERFFNRPWNFRPMWGSQHAFVDPGKFQLVKKAMKPLVESKQMSGLVKWQHRTPDWLLNVERGAGQLLFHRFYDEPTVEDEDEDQEETQE